MAQAPLCTLHEPHWPTTHMLALSACFTPVKSCGKRSLAESDSTVVPLDSNTAETATQTSEDRMSTRCTINFGHGAPHGEFQAPVAKIYRHSDGYPNSEHGVLADLGRFHEALPVDSRINDPSYLAAKFVVWQAGEFARGDDPLEFLSVGVLTEDPGDLEYTYWITDEGTVWYRTAGFRGEGEWKLAGAWGDLTIPKGA